VNAIKNKFISFIIGCAFGLIIITSHNKIKSQHDVILKLNRSLSTEASHCTTLQGSYNQLKTINEQITMDNDYLSKNDFKLIEPMKNYDKIKYLEEYKTIILKYHTGEKSIEDYTTPKEFNLLCSVVQAEIGIGNFDQKVNVSASIINRFNNKNFPDTWDEILMQKYNGTYQYSSVGNKSYLHQKVTPDTVEAIEYAWYFGSDDVKDATYFCVDSEKNSWHKRNLESVYDDGKHSFYK